MTKQETLEVHGVHTMLVNGKLWMLDEYGQLVNGQWIDKADWIDVTDWNIYKTYGYLGY